MIYCDKGDYDQAIADLDQAIKLKPGLYQAHYNLARVFALQRKLDQALSNLEQALKLNEQNKLKDSLEQAKNDPDFASIRDDPCFQDLLAKYE